MMSVTLFIFYNIIDYVVRNQDNNILVTHKNVRHANKSLAHIATSTRNNTSCDIRNVLAAKNTTIKRIYLRQMILIL
jgi:hypothetical protein